MRKFIPLLFSTMMVQALLAARKTITRRTKGLEKINSKPGEWEWLNFRKKNVNRLWDSTKEECPNPLETFFVFTNTNTGEELEVKCPYGKPGDILWVRETVFDAIFLKFKGTPLFVNGPDYLYKADNAFIGDHKWTSSIHMTKEACRLFLEVVSVRLERLQDISEEDEKAEGAEPKSC